MFHHVCAKHLFKMVWKVERVIALMDLTIDEKDNHQEGLEVRFSSLLESVFGAAALAGLQLA